MCSNAPTSVFHQEGGGSKEKPRASCLNQPRAHTWPAKDSLACAARHFKGGTSIRRILSQPTGHLCDRPSQYRRARESSSSTTKQRRLRTRLRFTLGRSRIRRCRDVPVILTGLTAKLARQLCSGVFRRAYKVTSKNPASEEQTRGGGIAKWDR